MSKKSKYNLKEAKELYMTFMPVVDISKQLNIPYKTLVYHTGKWKEERSLLRSEILKELSENKKAILTTLVGNSLEIVDRVLKDFKAGKRDASITEARHIVSMITDVDKILRLDDGNPTDIIAEHKPATVIELRDKLKRDPFYIEDANFREIAHEKTTTTSTNDSTDGNSRDTSGSSDTDSSEE